MTVLFQNQTANIETTPVVEASDVERQIIVSGTPGVATIDLYILADSLRPVAVKRFITGQVWARFKAGTSWYLEVSNVSDNTDLDCSYL